MKKQLGTEGNDWGKALFPDDKIKKLKTGIIQPYQRGTAAKNHSKWGFGLAALWGSAEFSADVFGYMGVSTATGGKIVLGATCAALGPYGLIVAGGVIATSAAAAYYSHINQKDPSAITTVPYSQQLDELRSFLSTDSVHTREFAQEKELEIKLSQEYFEKAIHDMDAEKKIIEKLKAQLKIVEASATSEENKKSVQSLREELNRREAQSKKHRGVGDERYNAYSEWNDKFKEIRYEINRKLYKEKGSELFSRTADETLEEKRKGENILKATYQKNLVYGFGSASGGTAWSVVTGAFSSPLEESTVLKQTEVHIEPTSLSSDPRSAFVLVQEHRKNAKGNIMRIDWLTPQKCVYDDGKGNLKKDWTPKNPPDDADKSRIRSQTKTEKINGKDVEEVYYQIKKDPALADHDEDNWTKLTVTNSKVPCFSPKTLSSADAAAAKEQQQILARKCFDLVKGMILLSLKERNEMPDKNKYIIFTANDQKSAEYVLAACRFFERVFPGRFTEDSYDIRGGFEPNVTADNTNKWSGEVDPKGTKETDKVYINYDKSSPIMQEFLTHLDFNQKTNLGGVGSYKPLSQNNPTLYSSVEECVNELARADSKQNMNQRGEDKKDLVAHTFKSAKTKTRDLPNAEQIANVAPTSLRAG
jgi:hypothetical protein